MIGRIRGGGGKEDKKRKKGVEEKVIKHKTRGMEMGKAGLYGMHDR